MEAKKEQRHYFGTESDLIYRLFFTSIRWPMKIRGISGDARLWMDTSDDDRVVSYRIGAVPLTLTLTLTLTGDTE